MTIGAERYAWVADEEIVFDRTAPFGGRPHIRGWSFRGRQAGKTTDMRRMLLADLAESGHVHYLTFPNDAWCVTRTTLGPLWELQRLCPNCGSGAPAHSFSYPAGG